MENNEQRSDQWFKDRSECFTSSEFHKLMSGGKRKMTPAELEAEKLIKGKRTTVDTLFGDTANTYIDTKLAGILSNGLSVYFESFAGNKATEYGEIQEPVAREAFTAETGIEVKECGFIKIDERLGGSPDGLTTDAIIEIKCPYVLANHLQNMQMLTVEDFISLHYEYYIQMQVNMIAAKVSKGYFISFDNRYPNRKLWLKILEVPLDENVKKDILHRYQEANKILSQKLEFFYNLIMKSDDPE